MRFGILAAIPLLFAVAQADAATIIQNLSFNNQSSADAFYNRFNSSLGVLQSVQADFTHRSTKDIVVGRDPTYVGPIEFRYEGIVQYFGVPSGQQAFSQSTTQINPGVLTSVPIETGASFSYTGSDLAYFIGSGQNTTGTSSQLISITGTYPGGSATVTPIAMSGGSNPRVFGTLRLTYVYDSAVPEPASWAMMMIGVAAIGGAARRARRRSAPAMC